MEFIFGTGYEGYAARSVFVRPKHLRMLGSSSAAILNPITLGELLEMNDVMLGCAFGTGAAEIPNKLDGRHDNWFAANLVHPGGICPKFEE